MQNYRSGGWLHENNFPDPWQLLPLPLQPHSTPLPAVLLKETQKDQSNEKRRLACAISCQGVVKLVWLQFEMKALKLKQFQLKNF